jgi:hypothetical protein
MKRVVTSLVMVSFGCFAGSQCQAQQYQPYGSPSRDLRPTDFRFNGQSWEYQPNTPFPQSPNIPYPSGGATGDGNQYQPQVPQNGNQYQPQIPQNQPPTTQPSPQYQQPNYPNGNQPGYSYSRPQPNYSQPPTPGYGYPYQNQIPNYPQFTGGGSYRNGVYCPQGDCDLIVPLDQFLNQIAPQRPPSNSYYQTPGANYGTPNCERDHFTVFFRECDLERWREYRCFSYSCEATDAAAMLESRGYLVRIARD